MNRVPVNSSNIESVGWESADPDDETGTLEVAFRSGHVYEYAEVPYRIYSEFVGASSPGRYHGQNIAGVYEHKRTR